jgi:polar amino acid transport system permease protein
VHFDFSPVLDGLPDLLAGLRATGWICLVAAVLATATGTVIALAGASRHVAVHVLTRGVIEVMRGMPFLVLLLCAFYILPRSGLTLSPWWTGVAALTLYYGVYFAEVARGAVAAIPPGQSEAAIAVGMSRPLVLARVILPQALGPMLPAFTGLLIGLIKESALLSVISVHEFAFAAREVVSDSYAPFETYAVVGLCYWLINGALDLVSRAVERRVTRFRRGRPIGRGGVS